MVRIDDPTPRATLDEHLVPVLDELVHADGRDRHAALVVLDFLRYADVHSSLLGLVDPESSNLLDAGDFRKGLPKNGCKIAYRSHVNAIPVDAPERVQPFRVGTTLDHIDRRLMEELRRDARTPNNVVAERLGIAPSTCSMRLKRLRDAGAIRGFHADLSPDALGLPIQAMIAVRVQPGAGLRSASSLAAFRDFPESSTSSSWLAAWTFSLRWPPPRQMLSVAS